MTSLAVLPPDAAQTTQASAPNARRKRRIPLALKFAAALIGLVTLVLLSNGAVNLWLNEEEAKRAVVGVQQEKARAAADRVDGFISDVENQIGWTTRAEWRRVPLEQQRYDFIRLLRQAPAVTEVSYIDPTGKEKLKVSRLEPDAVGSNKDFSADPRFTEAIAKKLWFGPVTFRRGSEPYMTIAVAHAGRDPGVTSAEVNLKLVWDVINGLRVGEKGFAFVVTQAGRLIAHPDLSLVLRDTDLSGLPQVARALPGANVATRQTSTPEISADFVGQSVLTASAPISRLGWIVLVQSPVSEALAPVFATLYQTLTLLGFGLLLAVVAGAFLARRMAAPIRALQEGTERLGSGDLSQRVTIRTGDEIETLADRFNAMAARIQDSYETLEAKVEARTRDLNESLEIQTATGEVLSVISRSPDDLQPVLDAIARVAQRICHAEDAHIYMLTDGVYRQTATTLNAPDDAWHAFTQATPITLDMPGSATARAARELCTVHVPDTSADPERDQGMFRDQTPRTVVSVPLVRDNVAVGVITLNRAKVDPFKPRQIELLTTFADQAVIAIANTRLFEEVQARTRDLQQSLEQQTATAEILNVIASSPSDMQPVFDAIAGAAVRLIGCTTVYVMLSDGKKLTPVSAIKRDGQHAPMSTGMPLDPAANFPSRAAIGKTLVQIPDFSLIDLPPQERIVHEQYGVRSAVILPMMRDGACLGVLAMTDGSANKFTDNDIALAEIFCNQAVIGIANVRLFNETKESLEQQTATAEVLKVISRSAFDLDAVLDTLVGTGMKLCDAEQGVIWLKRGGQLHLSTSGGYPQEWIEQSMANPITPDIDSATISGRVAATGQFVMVEDILEDQRFAGNAYHRIGQYRAVLMLPLLRGSNVEGTIGFTRRTPGPFNQRQIELVQTFADQAVIAIENARLFDEVQARTRELQASLESLRATQDRLVQSEKLASLGQLTAGIAHEIKNPLNFVNNFSALSSELIDELNEILEPAALDEKTRADVDEIAGLLKSNLAKVVQHGKRADSIVKNMLLHSREGSGERRMVDVNALVEESMNLAYHGARAERPGFNVTLEKTFDPQAGEADLLPQEVTRVLLNLISNGFYAANKRKTSEGEGFEPTVSAVTRSLGDRVEIRIRDNGTGIPDEVKAKIFNPFFTTKPAGEGTGLGLSLSHDIVVKQHGGTLDVETEAGAFTEFTIVLPRGGASQQTDRA
ncbi:MAG: GAF domain-containing protein [Beijerinckiaceae bacterium]|nr:GAF domain-containing protein [Beijerinckiaceae bacterium]